VEGAAANDLRQPAVPAEVKAERHARFMELSAEISAARLKRKVGRTLDVLVDRVDGEIAVARSTSDAPEIDGTVRIRGAGHLAEGSFAQVKITAAGAYDLEARLLR
jgi:ribosomal protein S12 methylthiotransferase